VNCPSCCKRISIKAYNAPYMVKGRQMHSVHECPHCGAVFGSCYKGDSYSIVRPDWAPNDTPMDDCFYYDLDVLGSDGIIRIHGWADKKTRRIVQVG
jgi:hypothetical protein